MALQNIHLEEEETAEEKEAGTGVHLLGNVDERLVVQLIAVVEEVVVVETHHVVIQTEVVEDQV